MFESTPLNPPDAIFGLNEEFKSDRRPDKVNLTVGVYKDDSGRTPLMRCVAAAEQRLVEKRENKSYLPIDGMCEYNTLIGNLILGDTLCPAGGLSGLTNSEPASAAAVHSFTTQTPGGTAALRIAADLLCGVVGVRRIWVSDPTWANHKNIFAAAGLEICAHGYLDASGTSLDFPRMMNSLEKAVAGDAILMHAVCHNPTGADLRPEDWEVVSEFMVKRRLIPVFDFAYQGFGNDIDPDAAPIREFCRSGKDALICNSFSKNFGLYGERVGGLTVVAGSELAATAVQSQVKSLVRQTWSNPPKHGAAIVRTILGDPGLRAIWMEELSEMRKRIKTMRQQFVNSVNGITPDRDYSFISRQTGMFSYTGLAAAQVKRLKEEFAIYALGTGRINICGLNSSNIAYVCEAIAKVSVGSEQACRSDG